MIVVSDTSPLRYLVLINAIDALPKLFGQVMTPPAVISELTRDQSPASVRTWATSPPDWLVIRQPVSVAIEPELGAGENQAIALARELKADRLLLDDAHARTIAESAGLRVISTVGVLVLASQLHLLDLKTTLGQLKQTKFRITRKLIESILKNRSQD